MRLYKAELKEINICDRCGKRIYDSLPIPYFEEHRITYEYPCKSDTYLSQAKTEAITQSKKHRKRLQKTESYNVIFYERNSKEKTKKLCYKCVKKLEKFMRNEV